MLRVADKASPPSSGDVDNGAHRAGLDAWIGYLRSPYAADSWTPAELDRIIVRAGRLLPVYVGPYNARTLAAMNPTRDAVQALSDLHELRAPHHGVTAVCLDIEPGAWSASPADVLAYFGAFRRALRAHGIDVAPYGSPSTLVGLGQHETIANVWCASWLAPYGKRPAHLWPTDIAPPGLGNAWKGRRAWQLGGGVKLWRGAPAVDLSLFPADFPLVVHETKPAPAPQPAPHPAPHPTPAPAPSPAPAPHPHATVAVRVDGYTYRGALPRV